MLKPTDHVLDYVDAYLHEALDPRDQETVERHCAACAICRLALDEARRRFEAMQAVAPVEAPEQLVHATMKKIERYRARRFTAVRVCLAAAASIALVLGGFHLYYATTRPTPYDLRVLGQDALVLDSDGSIRVLVTKAQTHRPIESVPIEIRLAAGDGRDVQLASLTTDRFGSGNPRFRLPNWEPGEYRLCVTARPGWGSEVVEQPIKLRRAWQVMLSSDKPVYQPGQTIRVRSLALARPDLKPVAGRDLVFSVKDPKGNVILQRADITSKFGIASLDCPLAAEILEGTYEIACRLGDTQSKLSVEVKKYVLPKFKVAVELNQPYFQPGDRVRGSVTTQYFFGKPVEKADVQIEASTVGVAGERILQSSATTDAAGVAHFEFTLPRSLVGRPQQSGDAPFIVTALATDSAGQKQSKSITCSVSSEAIRVEVIPESGTLVREFPNIVYILASYPDGRPARCRIVASGIDHELKTDALGVTSVELTPQWEKTDWTVRAIDGEGKNGNRRIALQCGTLSHDFLVRPDKSVYRGGETLRLTAIGGGREPLFVDLVKDGQTRLTEVVEMDAGRGELALDLPPDLFGTLQLSAYRYSNDGLPVSKTRVIYVHQARAIRIATVLDGKEYRPGGRAKLQFTLTDDQGKPAPGALSLAAVDEAVFSVLEQRPGLEQAFFTLEQELLKPVYAIYPWSPDFGVTGKQEERIRLENAVFSQAETLPMYGVSRSGGSVHTLVKATYQKKVRDVEQTRSNGLEGMKAAWIWFVVFLGALSVIAVFRHVWEYVALLLVSLIFVALVTPVGVRVREAARRLIPSGGLELAQQATMAGDSEREPATAEAPAFDKTRSSPSDDGRRGEGPSAAAPVRVRELFPETLLWRPELITDDAGRASLDLELADSITTWRLSASAVSAEGKLGAAETPIRVFQPFFVDLNLPVSLTRGDEVTVPAVVYNYLDKPQTVELRLADAPWFERLGDGLLKLDLAAGEVRSVGYRIRAKRVGQGDLTVEARSGEVADAIKRQVEVVPDGRRIEQTASGTLDRSAEVAWNVPQEAVEGSVLGLVKIYPSTFSQLVEGVDAIFQQPYGCFEQTSSTTYPNVLALGYLRETKKSMPAVEARARQYIHLGYQRLVSFEIAGGGFDWFGHPPANRTLTAYGLMEFCDMARVHDVDPNLIDRTRRWLLAQQRPDGSWEPEGHAMHEDPTGRGRLAQLSTTAYIAWAVFDGRSEMNGASAARDYLLRHEPASIDDPYVLALVANALLAIDPQRSSAQPYLQRLDEMKTVAAAGKQISWTPRPGVQTMFYGSGRGGSVETTAMAALAMLKAHQYPATVKGALGWLVAQKDGRGTWHSTQATVLALKALLAGTNAQLGEARERRIEIQLDGKPIETIVIPADQGEVMRQVALSSLLTAGPHRLTLRDPSAAGVGYQATLVHYVPDKDKRPAATTEPLAIELTYDKTELAVDDTLKVTLTLTNKMPTAAPMVILDLPIPAGFAIETGDLARLVADGTIAKYQLTPRQAIVYLRQIEPGRTFTLRYTLRATMPVKVTAPAARAYEYYNPDVQAATVPTTLTVAAR